MRPGLCNQHLRAAGKAQGAEKGVWVSKPEWILPVADEGLGVFLIYFFFSIGVVFWVWFSLAPFGRRPSRSPAAGSAPARPSRRAVPRGGPRAAAAPLRSAPAVARLAPAPPLTPQGQGQGEGLFFPELTGAMR